jgi:hypothetical protein
MSATTTLEREAAAALAATITVAVIQWDYIRAAAQHSVPLPLVDCYGIYSATTMLQLASALR